MDSSEMAAKQVELKRLRSCFNCKIQKATWDHHVLCWRCRPCSKTNTCPICEKWTTKEWRLIQKSRADLKYKSSRKDAAADREAKDNLSQTVASVRAQGELDAADRSRPRSRGTTTTVRRRSTSSGPTDRRRSRGRSPTRRSSDRKSRYEEDDDASLDSSDLLASEPSDDDDKMDLSDHNRSPSRRGDSRSGIPSTVSSVVTSAVSSAAHASVYTSSFGTISSASVSTTSATFSLPSSSQSATVAVTTSTTTFPSTSSTVLTTSTSTVPSVVPLSRHRTPRFSLPHQTPMFEYDEREFQDMDFSDHDDIVPGQADPVPSSSRSRRRASPEPRPLSSTDSDLRFLLPSGVEKSIPYTVDDERQVHVAMADLVQLVGTVLDIEPKKIVQPQATPRHLPVNIRNRNAVPVEQVHFQFPPERSSRPSVDSYLAPHDVKSSRGFPKVPTPSPMFAQPDTPYAVPSVSEDFQLLSRVNFSTSPVESTKKLSVPYSFFKDLYVSGVASITANDFCIIISQAICQLANSLMLPRQNMKAVGSLIECLADLQGAALQALMFQASYVIGQSLLRIRDVHLEHLSSEVTKDQIRQLRHAPWDPQSLFGDVEALVVDQFDYHTRVQANRAVTEADRRREIVSRPSSSSTKSSGSSFKRPASSSQTSASTRDSKRSRPSKKGRSPTPPRSSASSSFQQPFYRSRGGKKSNSKFRRGKQDKQDLRDKLDKKRSDRRSRSRSPPPRRR